MTHQKWCIVQPMIVSRGLGNSIIPVRLFNYPEIVCAELKYETGESKR